MITKCPHCNTKFNVRDEYKDKKTKCTKCQQSFIIQEFRRETIPSIGETNGVKKEVKVCAKCGKAIGTFDNSYPFKGVIICSECARKLCGIKQLDQVATAEQSQIAGERERCAHFKTPNILQKPEAIESASGPDLCYFCQEGYATAYSVLLMTARKEIVAPSYRCSKCGSEWKEPSKVDGSHTLDSSRWSEHRVMCRNCNCEDVVPGDLSLMPIDGHYREFHSLGMIEYGDGRRRLVLTGLVEVPRCQECKIIHTRTGRVIKAVFFITWVGATVFWFAVFMAGEITDTEEIGAVILATMLGFLFAAVITFPVYFLLKRRIREKTRPEDDAKDFTDVQKLIGDGWVVSFLPR